MKCDICEKEDFLGTWGIDFTTKKVFHICSECSTKGIEQTITQTMDKCPICGEYTLKKQKEEINII